MIMIEKFIDWYNDSDGEKKLLQITVCVFVAAAFLNAAATFVSWLNK